MSYKFILSGSKSNEAVFDYAKKIGITMQKRLDLEL